MFAPPVCMLPKLTSLNPDEPLYGVEFRAKVTLRVPEQVGLPPSLLQPRIHERKPFWSESKDISATIRVLAVPSMMSVNRTRESRNRTPCLARPPLPPPVKSI